MKNNNDSNRTLSSSRMNNDIVRPSDICKQLHNKTHFKAATSVFLGHEGVLKDTDKGLEKALNDFTVRR